MISLVPSRSSSVNLLDQMKDAVSIANRYLDKIAETQRKSKTFSLPLKKNNISKGKSTKSFSDSRNIKDNDFYSYRTDTSQISPLFMSNSYNAKNANNRSSNYVEPGPFFFRRTKSNRPSY